MTKHSWTSSPDRFRASNITMARTRHHRNGASLSGRSLPLAAQGRAKPKRIRSQRDIVKTDAEEPRRERALHERLFLLERTGESTFDVMGRSGNVYNVLIRTGSCSCTCPDARFRCKRQHVHCKHVLFIVLRVLGGTANDLSTPRGVTRLLSKTVRRATVASHDVAERYAALMRGEPIQEVAQRPPAAGDVCAVCYEDLLHGASAESLAFCRYGCGQAVHSACFSHWASARRRAREDVTCVYCRAHWDPPKPQGCHLARGQYLNVLSDEDEHADGSKKKRVRRGG